jgi:hypothetical protein
VQLVKGVDTGLMAIALLLFAGTYYIRIKHTTALASASKVPSAPLRENVQSLLEVTWPVDVSLTIGEPTRTMIKEKPRDLLYLGFMKGDHVEQREIKGIKQCQAKAQDPKMQDSLSKKRSVLLQTESSAVRNVVQLAIWEWVSMWLMAIAVVNTVVYNGFITDESRPDRVPRLVLILIYAAAFLLHFIYTWACFFRIYTYLVLDGCWMMLANAQFAAATRRTNFTKMTLYESSILGPTRLLETYEKFKDRDLKFIAKKAKEGNQAPKSIYSTQETEIKNFESATEAALERISSNATVILGIAVVTGFSTWTQVQLNDATSAQLGSLALLTTTVSGAGAMLSSVLHLSRMKNSSWRFLNMMESIISGQDRLNGDKPYLGFTRENIYRSVTLLDFWNIMSIYQIPWVLIFGPAYVLLVSHEERSYALSVRLGNFRVCFTTEKTDKHVFTNKLNVYLEDAGYNHERKDYVEEGLKPKK